jgi:NADP-dependent 3-hydroxy acid dehydrogenase YdfG
MKTIITGASKGIGHGIVKVLIEAGFEVGLLARSLHELEMLREEIRGAGGVAYIADADLRDHDQTADAIESLIEQLGGIDVLVNNAGRVIRQSALEISLDDWHDTIATNLHGLFYATRAVAPRLVEQGSGHIVNISSISGYTPLPGGAPYAASKHAVTGFSDSLFHELRDHGVKVTAVFPGSVDSMSHWLPGETDADHKWKLTAEQVGRTVLDVLRTDANHLVSRVEVRPLSRPPKR